MNFIRPSFADYEIADADQIMTPALAIYADILDDNIRSVLRLLGTVDRWRPHIKTAKLAFTIRRLVEFGVENMKCATTLELRTACEAGARDVLVAFPLPAPAVRRVVQIAEEFPDVTISALVENEAQVQLWRSTPVGLFIDINSGMNRTGVPASDVEEILRTTQAIKAAGLRFRGVHWYEGHHTQESLVERTAAAHAGYDVLMSRVDAIRSSGSEVEEVITSGTPGLPCALAYAPFHSAPFQHRLSPGTIVYNDCSSLTQLPPEYGVRPAAIVLARVVSHPDAGLITCDAGHKTVSADAGMPNCVVLGQSAVTPLRPSEEHLPLQLSPGSPVIPTSAELYLLPRHVCPTVNNFDHALIIRGGRVVAVGPVSARGRERPLPHTVELQAVQD